MERQPPLRRWLVPNNAPAGNQGRRPPCQRWSRKRECVNTFDTVDKETIILEIKRLAAERGNSPGQKVFQKETGISKSYWNGVYWPRWSAALEEAGFTPNQRNAALPLEELMQRYLDLVEELNSVPTNSELRMKARHDQGFPAASTFIRRLGPNSELLPRVIEYARNTGSRQDLIELLEANAKGTESKEEKDEDELVVGLVYLLRSGKYCKVGRSSNIERRIKEISISLPEDLELVHAIRTDDTVGIENYWHKRFAAKRVKGEWFDLSLKDIKSFSRRKFQ